jgi:hypothetical protein
LIDAHPALSFGSCEGFETACTHGVGGTGQVMKGWDKGVKTMRKGEQAIFTVQPQYAYGKAGRPPGIPPDTPLKFDIKLLSWCSVKDVCRDGGVMKKIVREGKSWENPKDADEVKGGSLSWKHVFASPSYVLFLSFDLD